MRVIQLEFVDFPPLHTDLHMFSIGNSLLTLDEC